MKKQKKRTSNPKWGKIYIKILGLNQTRLLNFFRSEKIVFFQLTILDNSQMCLYINKKDSKRVFSILDRFMYKHEIVEADFLISFFKHAVLKIGAVLACVVFCGVLILSNAIVWRIEIVGLNYVPYNLVQNIIKDNSVKKGMWATSVNKRQIKESLLKLDFVVDANISFYGTTLRVELFENFLLGGVDKDKGVIAKYDAIIDKVIVTEGRAVVQKGDIVKVGDELISGIIYDTNGQVLKTTLPKGEVYGSVVLNSSQYVAEHQIEYKESGREHTTTNIGVFGLNLGGNNPPKYEYYDTIKTSEFVFGKMLLPIKYNRTVYKELLKVEKTIKIDDEKEQIIKSMQEMLMLKGNGNIISSDYSIKTVLGGWRVDVWVVAYLLIN